MKNLTSIPEHSEYLEKTFKFEAVKWDMHMKRVRFGKQPLEIWKFIPCKLVDGVWVVLEEPESLKGFYETDSEGMKQEAVLRKEYQEAKERCLFEGYDGTIEHLQNLLKLKITVENMVKYGLQLTPTAKKQIGL